MRTYRVWLKGADAPIEIKAEDVNLEGEGDRAFWNFLTINGDNDDVTVGAFPWDSVAYIASVS
jgi:hypothetical protein